MRLEFGQFYKDKVEPFYHLVGVFDVDDVIVMVKLFQVGHEHVVDETERVYRMQISEIITSVELLDISL